MTSLVRGSDPAARQAAALDTVSPGVLLSPEARTRLRVLPGDVSLGSLGLDEATLASLAAGTGSIWHCAASFKDAGREETDRVNVRGTAAVVEFAKRCARLHPCSLYYVSTAFAAPTVCGLSIEELAPITAPARNAYERSKQAAERLVAGASGTAGLSLAIFRPSVVIGDSQTGRAAGYTAYYDVLRAMHLLAVRGRVGPDGFRILGRGDLPANLVTIDFVIDTMCRLAAARARRHLVYHVVHGAPTTTGEALRAIVQSVGLPGIRFAEPEEFAATPMTRAELFFHRMAAFEGPYLRESCHFDTAHLRDALPEAASAAPRVDANLLALINRQFLEQEAATDSEAA